METSAEFAKLLSTLAVEFINMSPERINLEINTALERIGNYAKVDRSYIFRFSEDGVTMSNTHEWSARGVEPQSKRLQDLSVRYYDWMCSKIKQGEMLFVPRVHELDGFAENEKEEWIRQDVKSLINFPLHYKDEVIGFIGFHAVKKEAKWSEEILALLKIAGDMIASVLVREYEEVERQREVQEFSVLNQLANASTEADTVEELLERAVDIVGRAVDSDVFGIGMIDQDDPGVVHGYLRDKTGESIGLDFNARKGIVGRVLAYGRPALVDDVRKDPDYVKLREDVRSQLVAPIRVGGRVVGAVNMESFQEKAYTDWDLQLITLMAGQLGTMVEKLQLFEQVQDLAIHDSLTGLYNRRYFFEAAQKEFAQARRYGYKLTAMMLDLDKFKTINDFLGHAIGDELLIAIADVLNKHVRVADLVARYGGDEFVALLTGCDVNAAVNLSNRLLNRFNLQATEIIQSGIEVTASFGIAGLTDDCLDVENLVDWADQALLAAKREKDSQFMVWEPGIRIKEEENTRGWLFGFKL